ncbi:Hypothetical predicted protein [Olea europaea subsp. europaea]|uniref:Uncharacterized protein n=1 Tax=Olea europaea subsp. europaea TaxID=158383 RepID=A0A8S0TTL8_OLEEU|nr:Hypothetical predicted protein [Olea europaea subsp. europaea]
MTCSLCGERGHNKRYHSRSDAPAIVDRGSQASTEHNPVEKHSFHFIPTPMVTQESRSSYLESGPTTMMSSQSVPGDVPTDIVNFDDVVDDLQEYGTIRGGMAIK